MKENIERRIETIKRTTPEGCSKRGGVDCSLGADNDGSVVCADGWTGAVQRYKQACSEVHLTLTRLPVDEDGPELIIAVRNTSGIVAREVKAVLEGGKGEKRTLLGPSELQPFAVGRYELQHVDPNLRKSTIRRALPLKVSCSNCGTGFMLTIPNRR
jgi:hypothetical protein